MIKRILIILALLAYAGYLEWDKRQVEKRVHEIILMSDQQAVQREYFRKWATVQAAIRNSAMRDTVYFVYSQGFSGGCNDTISWRNHD